MTIVLSDYLLMLLFCKEQQLSSDVELLDATSDTSMTACIGSLTNSKHW